MPRLLGRREKTADDTLVLDANNIPYQQRVTFVLTTNMLITGLNRLEQLSPNFALASFLSRSANFPLFSLSLNTPPPPQTFSRRTLRNFFDELDLFGPLVLHPLPLTYPTDSLPTAVSCLKPGFSTARAFRSSPEQSSGMLMTATCSTFG
jgi:hypothetical protein